MTCDPIVYRFAHNGDVVMLQMAAGDGPSRIAVKGRLSKSIGNRRATQLRAHFQRSPPGRGRLVL